MRIEKDSNAVFDAAIRAGVLSEDPGDDNFAGHYMYMHHDGNGAAWFKHRETRAYVTLEPEAAEVPAAGRPHRVSGPGAGLWVALALAGVFLAGLLIVPDRGPRVGTVRLNELTEKFFEGAVQGAETPEQTAAAARTWGVALEFALDAVARRNGIVLLPAEAVVAGAPDYTWQVRDAMQELQWAAEASDAGYTAPAETVQ